MKNISTLSNGLRIVSDYIEHVETVSLGAWFGIGACFETKNVNGISHVLEHMAFKGTTSRTACEISKEIESVGGYLNAYTSRESTAYYARVLKEHSPLAVDVLGDILQNSVFDKTELEKEKKVILQEIGQTLDTPDDIVFDYFQEACFPDQAMGRSILGPAENVKNFTSDQVRLYMKDHYSAKNMVFAAAGNIDHNKLVDDVEKAFSNLTAETTTHREESIYKGGDFRRDKDLEQVHLVIGLNGVSIKHEDYYNQMLAATILGGGMSSRLFQEIREKRGLVYTISSFVSPYSDAGIFAVYAGTGAEQVGEFLPTALAELHKLPGSIEDEELSRAKAQLKASLMMGLESTSNRCERIANQLLIHNRFIETSEVINLIDNVTKKSISDFMDNLLKGTPTLTTLGPIKDVQNYDDFLNMHNTLLLKK